MSAPSEPAANPAVAPAQRSRVGARSLRIQTKATNRGAASNAIRKGHTLAVEPTIDAEHVARAVVYMASLPLDANVLFMTVMATKMPFVGRG